MLVLCALVAVITLPSNVLAADAETTADILWQEGINAYSNKNYNRAVECFEQVAELGYGSADVFYNLGDAYFKLGQQSVNGAGRAFASGELGRAIVNYYRALRLNPAMKDARYNLDLAIDHTNDTEAVPQPLLSRGWRALCDMLSSNTWAQLSVVMLFCALLLALLYLLLRRVVVRKVTFAGAVITLVLFVVTTALSLSQRAAYLDDTRAVVVCNDTTPVHASPDSSSKIIRRPSQGVTVTIVRDHNGWFEIEFADGERGWIRSTVIERI